METVETTGTTLKEPVKLETENCCLKCRNKLDNTCNKQRAERDAIYAGEDKNYAALNEYQADVLADYVYKEHHQYYYTVQPDITNLLLNCMDHLETKDYDLERLEGLFRNLTTDLNTHFLVEETVLFPRIKAMTAAHKNLSFIKPSGMEHIRNAVNVMQTEHEAAEDILEEIESLTNNYTPKTAASTNIVQLYSKLKALHKNLEQHIYIENHILYPKALLLEEELNKLQQS